MPLNRLESRNKALSDKLQRKYLNSMAGCQVQYGKSFPEGIYSSYCKQNSFTKGNL